MAMFIKGFHEFSQLRILRSTQTPYNVRPPGVLVSRWQPSGKALKNVHIFSWINYRLTKFGLFF